MGGQTSQKRPKIEHLDDRVRVAHKFEAQLPSTGLDLKNRWIARLNGPCNRCAERRLGNKCVRRSDSSISCAPCYKAKEGCSFVQEFREWKARRDKSRAEPRPVRKKTDVRQRVYGGYEKQGILRKEVEVKPKIARISPLSSSHVSGTELDELDDGASRDSPEMETTIKKEPERNPRQRVTNPKDASEKLQDELRAERLKTAALTAQLKLIAEDYNPKERALSARASSLFGYMFIQIAHCQQDMEAMDGNTRPNREAIKRVREMLEQMRSELLNITREFPIPPLGDSPSRAPGRQVRPREELEEVEDSGEDSDEKQKVRKTKRLGQG